MHLKQVEPKKKSKLLLNLFQIEKILSCQKESDIEGKFITQSYFQEFSWRNFHTSAVWYNCYNVKCVTQEISKFWKWTKYICRVFTAICFQGNGFDKVTMQAGVYEDFFGEEDIKKLQ